MKHITPPGIRPPFARYSCEVEIPPGSHILVCSGQLGIVRIFTAGIFLVEVIAAAP